MSALSSEYAIDVRAKSKASFGEQQCSWKPERTRLFVKISEVFNRPVAQWLINDVSKSDWVKTASESFRKRARKWNWNHRLWNTDFYTVQIFRFWNINHNIAITHVSLPAWYSEMYFSLANCSVLWTHAMHPSTAPYASQWAPNLHLASSEQWCWCGGRGILTELSLCYSIV